MTTMDHAVPRAPPAVAPNGSRASAENAPPPPPARERLRVLIADDDPLARRFIRDVLQHAVDIIVIGEAVDGVEAIELALHYRPDLLLTDIGLRRLDGMEVIRRVSADAPEVTIVVFTVDASLEVALAAVRAGAAGILAKEDVSIENLARALIGAADGEAPLSRRMMTHLVGELRDMPQDYAGMRPVKSTLTGREWEVLDLVSAEESTQQIARSLVLSEDTIYTHVKNIMRKLGVHSRAEAVVEAERLRHPKRHVA